jgi:5-methyltetrahydrofolate--homocysteine methyltransferase
MAIENKGIEEELEWVEDPTESGALRAIFERAEPIMEDIAYGVIAGDQQTCDTLTRKAIDDGLDVHTILDDGLIAGMSLVGVKFRDNIVFVPEVLVSARAMKAGMAHIDPILSDSGIDKIAIVIMGTVKGDLHDIGKNLCIMMLNGAGFEVHDLGVDTGSEEFIEGVKEHDAKIVGMSALLTTTSINIGKTIQEFKEVGLGDVKTMAGGAALNQELATEMGCDGYGRDAIACVERAKEFAAVREAG